MDDGLALLLDQLDQRLDCGLKAPGTPDVTLRAASQSTSNTPEATNIEKKIVSRLKIEKSMIDVCLPVDRCVR